MSEHTGISSNAARRVLSLPTALQLYAVAIDRTDFLDESGVGSTDNEIRRAAIIATDQVVEEWEEEAGFPGVTFIREGVVDAVIVRLVHHAVQRNEAAEQDARDQLADEVAAGDRDRNGNVIPYPCSWGGR